MVFRSPARDRTAIVAGRSGDVLILSVRRLANLVAFCLQYEFEDVITDVTGADRVEAGDWWALEFSRRAYKVSRFATGSPRLARASAPPPSTVKLDRDYDLFFPVFNSVHELFALATVPGWRERCRVAACFINEVWAPNLPGYLLELLAQFDHVFLGTRHPVEEVARITGRPCSYLPLAVDVLRFSPCPDTVAASGIDRKQRTFKVDDASEHRLLLANLLQRTSYFIANRALVNHAEITMGRDEISGRFYEGAAAGAVMLGEPPRTEEFNRQFDWPDALIRLPFDSPEIGRFLDELDRDPGRLARIRAANIRNAALRHDWIYRLRTVFEAVGIAPTGEMLAREARLRTMAALLPGVSAGDELHGYPHAGPGSGSVHRSTAPARPSGAVGHLL
jgi:hypothetical protein